MRMWIYVSLVTAWWSREDQRVCETAITDQRFHITSKTILFNICGSCICCRSSSDKSSSDEMPEWYMGICESAFHSIFHSKTVSWNGISHFVISKPPARCDSLPVHTIVRCVIVVCVLVDMSTFSVLPVINCWVGQEQYALSLSLEAEQQPFCLSLWLTVFFKRMLVQTGINT